MGQLYDNGRMGPLRDAGNSAGPLWDYVTIVGPLWDYGTALRPLWDYGPLQDYGTIVGLWVYGTIFGV